MCWRRANYIRVNKNYGRHAQNFNYKTREIIAASSAWIITSPCVSDRITTYEDEGLN